MDHPDRAGHPPADGEARAGEARDGEPVDRAEAASARAEEAARQAESAARGALQTEVSRREGRDGPTLVSPDDPLLDTAIRRVAADASEEHPYGRPGQPMPARSPFRIGFSAALGVALAYLLVQAAIQARSALTLVLVAAVLAIGLNPTVERLDRRLNSRGLAVAVVFVLVIGFFVGFGFAAVPPIVDQVSKFVAEIPQYLERLQANPTIDRLNQQFQLIDRAQQYVTDGSAGGRIFGGLLGVGRVVFGAFFSALTVLILTLYFLASFTSIKRTAYRLVPRSRRPRVTLLTDEILARVGGYVAGALSIAAIAGGSSFVFLLVVSAPFPLALALLVGVLDLVPLVGATIGAAAATGVCFFVDVRTGVLAVAFFVLYQQVENYVIYPRIMRRSVDVSPAATIVAVLIGGGLLGAVGALLAIPVTAALQLIMREVLVPRQDQA